MDFVFALDPRNAAWNSKATCLAFVSPQTAKVMQLFPGLVRTQEGMLRGYHNHAAPAIGERLEHPLDNIRMSARLVHTMFLSKSVFYCRAIIENVNSGNLLVAFQSLRALVEVLAAVRYTIEQMKPVINACANRGTTTGDEARQLNYQFDILLHGGRFDWEAFFLEGAWAVLEKKKKERPKHERQQFAARAQYLKVDKCIKDWAKVEPIAEFVYDYLCDLVHPNKGSNLVLIVENSKGLRFDIEGQAKFGLHIFDKIFPIAASLCMREVPRLIIPLAMLGADEEQFSEGGEA